MNLDLSRFENTELQLLLDQEVLGDQDSTLHEYSIIFRYDGREILREHLGDTPFDLQSNAPVDTPEHPLWGVNADQDAMKKMRSMLSHLDTKGVQYLLKQDATRLFARYGSSVEGLRGSRLHQKIQQTIQTIDARIELAKPEIARNAEAERVLFEHLVYSSNSTEHLN
jgi:hypothetical protein